MTRETKVTQKKRDPKFDEDLRENPGIGASKGAFAMHGEPDDLEDLEGVNTYEGDVENDTTPVGSVPEGKLGRTNK